MTLLRRARETLRELRTITTVDSLSVLENPQFPLTSTALLDLLNAPNTTSGVWVDEFTAQSITAVYRAWSLIAGSIGSLPLKCFVGEAPGGDRWYGDQAGLLAYPGGRDPVTGIPLPGTPPAMLFYETLMVNLLAWGNAYIVKVPAAVGGSRIVMLDLLRPDFVMPYWVPKSPQNPAGKVFVISDPYDAEPLIATPNDVIHIRALGHDLRMGISPIGAARQALGLAVAAEEYGASLFGSGSLMAGILQTDQKLTEPQAVKLRERWKTKLQGLSNAHDVAVLDAGIKWQPISIPPVDSQFIQAREFSITEVARLYGIPPHLMAQVDRTTSWGRGIEEQGINFNIYTLRVWLSRVEQAISNELLPRGVNARFDVTELLRGDTKDEIATHQAAIQSAQETPNEARNARGLPPLPGGDKLLMPSSFATVDLIVNPPATPAAAPGQSLNQPDQSGGGGGGGGDTDGDPGGTGGTGDGTGGSGGGGGGTAHGPDGKFSPQTSPKSPNQPT